MLSDQDKLDIANMIAAAMGAATTPAPAPSPTPAARPEPMPVVTSTGPLNSAMGGLLEVSGYVELANNFSVSKMNRFTRSDVYTLAAIMIAKGMRERASWMRDSAPSWRFAAEAFQTRASEVSGDRMTTEWLELESHEQFGTGVDLGVTEHACNMLSLILRKTAGQLEAQTSDRDLGPSGEVLTGGECVRVAYTALDALIDAKILPGEASSVFMKVRKEMYAQYKAMGEGVFGSWSHPGTPVPWSWAG